MYHEARVSEGGQDDKVVRLSRYDQAVIGRLLRDMYRHFVREGIPPHLMRSFRRLEARLRNEPPALQE